MQLTTSIVSHVARMVQKAGMLSGRKSVNICLKMRLAVSRSGERNTAHPHIIKVAVSSTEKGLVHQLSGILRSQGLKALCITSAVPCMAPQITNVILLPCQIPTSNRVKRQLRAVRQFPFLLPPKVYIHSP